MLSPQTRIRHLSSFSNSGDRHVLPEEEGKMLGKFRIGAVSYRYRSILLRIATKSSHIPHNYLPNDPMVQVRLARSEVHATASAA